MGCRAMVFDPSAAKVVAMCRGALISSEEGPYDN